jgi:hypothetical protein
METKYEDKEFKRVLAKIGRNRGTELCKFEKFQF